MEPVEPVADAEAAFGSNLPESYSQIDGSFLEAIGEEERARLREHYRAVAENRRALLNADAPEGRIELEGHDAGEEEEADDGATGEDVVVALVADADVDAFRAALAACVEGGDHRAVTHRAPPPSTRYRIDIASIVGHRGRRRGYSRGAVRGAVRGAPPGVGGSADALREGVGGEARPGVGVGGRV